MNISNGDTENMDQFFIEYGAKLESLLENTSSQKNSILSHLKDLDRDHKFNFGVSIPKISFRKNNALEDYEYQFIIHGEVYPSAKIVPDAMMAIPPKHNSVTLPGIELLSPQLNIPVVWIPNKKTKKAESLGFSLVTPLNVLMQHIAKTVQQQLDSFFTKEEFMSYKEKLSDKCQSYLSEIIPGKLTFGALLSIFQMLLAEKVSIRDSGLILKAILEAAQTTQDVIVITEHVRGSLARQITAAHLSGKGYLPLIPLSEEWEKEFSKGKKQGNCQLDICLEAPVQHAFHDSLAEILTQANAEGESNPIILTRASSRRAVQSLLMQFSENIPVLSQNEIHDDIELKTIGWIS